jgi:hypothetical protein
MAPPEKPAIQSARNHSTTVSLYEYFRLTVPRVQPPDISQKYIILVVFGGGGGGGGGGGSEFCPALLETAFFEFLLSILETLLCSVSVQVKLFRC